MRGKKREGSGMVLGNGTSSSLRDSLRLLTTRSTIKHYKSEFRIAAARHNHSRNGLRARPYREDR